MDEQSRWKTIFAKRSRKLLPLDLENCSPISLRSIILNVRTPAQMLDRIAQTYCTDDEVLRDLVRCPNLHETTLAFIALTASEEVRTFIAQTRVMDVDVTEGAAAPEGTAQPATGKKRLSAQQLVLKMSPSQKIKLAMTGAKEARGLLIRESSKTIALSVLSNPRITIGEVEFFAKSQNLSEDVIRKIGSNAEWTRKPSIASALVSNPKTPVGISMGFVPRLGERELGILEKSRNIPEAVRSAARRTLAQKKAGKG